jgi:hypothetical protein
MASLRNLAVGAHRLIGRTDIAEATRWAGRNMTRPFQILNLVRQRHFVILVLYCHKAMGGHRR